MPTRIWKRDARGELRGAGNGFKAVIYRHVETEAVTVNVYKGDNWIGTKTCKNEAAGKRHAETYLKGTK